MTYLLPLLILVPTFGAIIAAVLPRASATKGWALGVALLTGALAVAAGLNTPVEGAFVRFPLWLSMGSATVSLSLGLDAISLCLVLLTVLLVPLAIASTFGNVGITTDRPRQFYAWMLALLAAMLGVFLARDLILFYACFELTLVPSFFLIGIWGGPERREAANKFFLYTFAGVGLHPGRHCLPGCQGPVVRHGRGDPLRPAFADVAREQKWLAIGVPVGVHREVGRVPAAHVAAAGLHRGADRRHGA